MPYVNCPRCGEETIRVEIVHGYEPDTNAGGAPEITAIECGHGDLSPVEEDIVYAEIERIDFADFYPEPF